MDSSSGCIALGKFQVANPGYYLHFIINPCLFYVKAPTLLLVLCSEPTAIMMSWHENLKGIFHSFNLSRASLINSVDDGYFQRQRVDGWFETQGRMAHTFLIDRVATAIV